MHREPPYFRREPVCLHDRTAVVLNQLATPRRTLHTAATLYRELPRIQPVPFSENQIRRALHALHRANLLVMPHMVGAHGYALSLGGALTWATWRHETLSILGHHPEVAWTAFADELGRAAARWGIERVDVTGTGEWDELSYELHHGAFAETIRPWRTPASLRTAFPVVVIVDALAAYSGSRIATLNTSGGA